MKNRLIILGHPLKDSYCGALTDKYVEGAATSSHKIERLNLGDIAFDPLLKGGYSEQQELEPDLLEAQRLIKKADHIVFVYPTWWATPPALMKGFIERTFIPGFAFNYRKDSLKCDKHLTGKTARLIVTMDSPPWYYKWIVHDPGAKMMRDILSFCGIKPIKKSYFGSIKTSTSEKRTKWLQQAFDLGAEVE